MPLVKDIVELLLAVDVDINFRRRGKGSSKMGFKVIYILVLAIIRNFFTKK